MQTRTKGSMTMYERDQWDKYVKLAASVGCVVKLTGRCTGK